MAYRFCFIRVPKYKNISFRDIQLIERYLQWRKQKDNNTKSGQGTFQQWCGHSLEELPPVDAVEYYRAFFERKHTNNDDNHGYQCFGIFEQLARFSKASQIPKWFNDNSHITVWEKGEYYEIDKETLENFLSACNNVRRHGLKFVEYDLHGESIYTVDEDTVKNYLPILEGDDGTLSFPWEYGELYARQVIEAIQKINEILFTTNFEKESIYVNYY